MMPKATPIFEMLVGIAQLEAGKALMPFSAVLF